MLRMLLFVFSILRITQVSAQGIDGTIIDNKGKAVPFANMYVPALKTGTTSNIEGKYSIDLPPGKHDILFQYLGYETVTKEVEILDYRMELNVVLTERRYALPELKVLSSGEDPAYYIMRHAISMAPYYSDQVSEYQCQVYLKGTGVFTHIPRLLKKQMEKEGLEKNKPFVMETISDIAFKLPDETKQKVVAMRSSGDDNNTSPMYMITSSLYKARDYEMISPVDRAALSVYAFELQSTFEDQERTIHKIKVRPKRKGQDLFEGTIFIADQFWNIHSADLSINIPMGKVRMKQLYGRVAENTWMPVSLDFDIQFKGLGLALTYTYVATISDYKVMLNPNIDHSILENALQSERMEQQVLSTNFDNERPDTLKIKQQKKLAILLEKEALTNREAIKLQKLMQKEVQLDAPPEPLELKSAVIVSDKNINNDSTYWAKLRPIPLLEAEQTSFAGKDSLLRVSSTPEYKDSVYHERRHFKVKHLALGKTYNYSADSVKTFRTFYFPGLVYLWGISYNTVDGLRLDYPFKFHYSDTTGKALDIEPFLGYAFSRQVLEAQLKMNFRWDGISQSKVGFDVGKKAVDFNEETGMPALMNSDYTLFYKQNFKKFFSKTFINLHYQTEITNGLRLHFSTEFASRSPLQNTSFFTFIDWERDFTANVPTNTHVQDWHLEASKKYSVEVGMQFTPRHRYSIQNNVKSHIPSKYPTFSLLYKGAFGGDSHGFARYDYLEGGITQQFKMGLLNVLSYEIKTGGFSNNSRTYFTDFKHFNTYRPGLMLSPENNMFRLIPFYEASVNTWFSEAHVNYSTQRLLIKRLPFLGNSLISENLIAHYLYTPDFKNYYEFGYGIRDILLFFNLEVNASFQGSKYLMTGFKLGFNIN